MLDTEFIGFQDDELGGQIPLFNVIRPFHKLKGSTVTLETCLKKNLSFDKQYMDYHVHDFYYDKGEDLKLCDCGEQEEYDLDEPDEPAYGSEKE